MRKLSGELRETLLAGQRFAEAAEKVLLVAARLVGDDTDTGTAGGHGAPADTAETRDITDYTAAAGKFTEAANEMRRALESANNLLESEAWQRRVDDLDRVAAGRIADAGGRGEGLVDRIFWRALVLVLVFLAGLWFVRARTRGA